MSLLYSIYSTEQKVVGLGIKDAGQTGGHVEATGSRIVKV